MVGTGAFMLTDYVEASSFTFTKNPNYWGYDEKYPDNRLPYIDQLRGGPAYARRSNPLGRTSVG